ncbi:hypothetical protein OGATHE_006607 [Ogataea polymorpha]|uniref:Uncharacterized protein n=1 Tax=Ogataea polymorpha TaxID=460523 RepID=A0A9P8SYV4_9ASCO|nr:hypothetical protein OGATHE_006607 [Ogataea polymorpha]
MGIHLFRSVKDISTQDLALLHLLEDLRQLGKTGNLEWRTDKASGEEVHGLGSVLSVTNIRSLDLDGLDDVLKDRRFANSAGWKTNQNNLTEGSHVLTRLGDSSWRHRHVDDTVWTAIGDLLDGRHNVLLLGEVDVEFGTELLDELALLLTTVNTQNSQTHGDSVLNGKRTQSTGGTGNSNNLTWTQSSSLQGLVNSHTSTQNWSNSSEVSSWRQLSGLDSVSSGVLLERTVVCVTGKVGVRTVWFGTLLTELTTHTRAVQPFDTGQVADLEVFNVLTLGNDNTGTLVTTHKWEFDRQWPVTLPGVQVGVAHTRVLDVDQNLVWLWLWNWDLLVLNWTAVGFKNTSHLGLWDGWSRGSGVSEDLLDYSRLG